MSELSVVVICLTKDRPEMTQRTVACFLAQSHPKKRLLVYDTSEVAPEPYPQFDAGNVLYFHAGARTKTIGELRNEAIEFAQMAVCPGQFDIVAHFDSDDFSGPQRIAEQVALLQSSGADCVGYNEMLFWREPKGKIICQVPDPHGKHLESWRDPGEAWLYSNKDPRYALGTSLCYWRRTWERKPFEATSQGEDMRFIAGLKVAAGSAMDNMGAVRIGDNPPADCFDVRMIARIHAGNTSTGYRLAVLVGEARKRHPMWKRVPQWDKFCAEQFK